MDASADVGATDAVNDTDLWDDRTDAAEESDVPRLDGHLRDSGAPEAPASADATAHDGSSADAAAPDGEIAPGADAGSDVDPGPIFVPHPDLCGAAPAGASPPRQVIDTGHGKEIALIRRSGDRLLTQDLYGHWVLWDTSTRARLASGQSPWSQSTSGPAFADLRGSTMVTELPSRSYELRDARTGAVTAVLPPGTGQPGLAVDGSYFWFASAAQLGAWSPDGRQLISRLGDYTSARVFAAANELRVAVGGVVERIDIATGSTTSRGTYAGSIHSWFLDGDSFLTASAGRIARVYPMTGEPAKGIFELPSTANLTGRGEFFWTHPGGTYELDALDVYAVEGTSAPVFSLPANSSTEVIPSEDLLGVIDYGALRVVRLESPAPTLMSDQAPLPHVSAFAAGPDGDWWVGDVDGLVRSRSNVTLGCGKVLSIAGARDGTVAISTAGAGILLLDLSAGGTMVRPSIPLLAAPVALSAGGDLLAGQVGTDLKVLAASDAAETWSWSLGSGFVSRQRLVLAASGTRIAWLGTDTVTLAAVGGTELGSWPVTSMNSMYRPTHWLVDAVLSPDGSGLAIGDFGSGPSIRIYRDAAIVGSASGQLLGWLSNDRLLVQRYQVAANGRYWEFVGSVVLDPTGTVVEQVSLPEMYKAIVLPPNEVYSISPHNAVFDVNTGAEVWRARFTPPASDALESPPIVAGSFIVWTDGREVSAESR